MLIKLNFATSFSKLDLSGPSPAITSVTFFLVLRSFIILIRVSRFFSLESLDTQRIIVLFIGKPYIVLSLVFEISMIFIDWRPEVTTDIAFLTPNNLNLFFKVGVSTTIWSTFEPSSFIWLMIYFLTGL